VNHRQRASAAAIDVQRRKTVGSSRLTADRNDGVEVMLSSDALVDVELLLLQRAVTDFDFDQRLPVLLPPDGPNDAIRTRLRSFRFERGKANLGVAADSTCRTAGELLASPQPARGAVDETGLNTQCRLVTSQAEVLSLSRPNVERSCQ